MFIDIVDIKPVNMEELTEVGNSFLNEKHVMA